jgi:hypothetical protein
MKARRRFGAIATRLPGRGIAPLALTALPVIVGVLFLLYGSVSASFIAPRSLTISDNQASSTGVTYKFTLGTSTAASMGSIRLQLCDNDPFLDTPCNAPFGLDFSSATLTSQTGETGFSKSAASTSNEIILTRAPQMASPGVSTYTISNVKNPANTGSYFGRLQTYGSIDATGSSIDGGGIAWVIASGVGVATEVPPYLDFCAGVSIVGTDCATAQGDYLNLGELSASQPKYGQTQLMAATNAQSGYSVTLGGTTLTSGNNVISPMSGQTSLPGTNQFGINLRSNINPAVGEDPTATGIAVATSGYDVPNHFRFSIGDVIITSNDSDNYKKFTASYIVNIVRGQAPGVYVSTVSYICLANF